MNIQAIRTTTDADVCSAVADTIFSAGNPVSLTLQEQRSAVAQYMADVLFERRQANLD